MADRKYKVVSQPLTFLDSNPVPISLELHAAINQVNKQDWQALFQNFRLSFRSRILSRQGDGLVKLQGMLEGVNEIETVILDMMLKPE
jgi:hypothetical protein